MDPCQYFLFAGGANGKIYETKLNEKKSLVFEENAEEKESVFVGHTLKVTCLAVTNDGLALFSGSDDKGVKMWSISSKLCVRTVFYEAAIGNLLIAFTPMALTGAATGPPKFIVKKFNRGIDDSYGETKFIMKLSDKKHLTEIS